MAVAAAVAALVELSILPVNLSWRTFYSTCHRVKRTVAVAAVVAALVELPATGVHRLRHEDDASAAGAAVAVLGLDLSDVETSKVGHRLHLVPLAASGRRKREEGLGRN